MQDEEWHRRSCEGGGSNGLGVRAHAGSSPRCPPEPRHRPSGTGATEETIKKRLQKGKNSKDLHKFALILERTSIKKLRWLHRVVFAVMFVTVLMLIAVSTINEDKLQSTSRLVSVGWIWDHGEDDGRYVSDTDVDWDSVRSVIRSMIGGGDDHREQLAVGLLNFNSSEVGFWRRELLPGVPTIVVNLEHAGQNITWDDLYPEWIDEEEEREVPVCPTLPDPWVPTGARFNLVATKLPCNPSENWSRNVVRLHLQLSAAKLAVASSSADGRPVHVLLVTDPHCFPITNLFSCKHVVGQEGNAWLYRPDLNILQEKLRLPVGSCQLAVPLEPQEEVGGQSPSNYIDRPPQREAYATILHSASEYVCGAITAAQSIRRVGSTRDLVILVDESITEDNRRGLEAAGWQVRVVERIRNPKAQRDAYNEWNYSKFRLWQLTDYDKIIFIDADLLVLRNIDLLFDMPEISATGNNRTLFNSGVMVIEPSNCTFAMLMRHINEIRSYNGGDQGYLNEIFTWWHRIPKRMNFLKHIWEGDEEAAKLKKTALYGADPPVLYVLHYLGAKPWLCFRDYDCNWNIEVQRLYASDVAHARWWAVHDAMPAELQRHCLLRSVQKAGLEWDRRQAEKAGYSDEHWRVNISDPRMEVCIDQHCDWQDMLLHWGVPENTTEGGADKVGQ